MIMSIFSSSMDYPCWLTISGFVMTMLVFFLTHVITNISNDNIYSHSLKHGYITNTLLIIIIFGILFFIFDEEPIGAIIVTILLIVVPIYSLILFHQFKIKVTVDQLVRERYQQDI